MADDAHAAKLYHQTTRERDALAMQLAHEWGWPDGDSVLTRLRGDRTAALTTFEEDAMLVYLGERFSLTLTPGPKEDEDG